MSIAERLKEARINCGFKNASAAAERFQWKAPTYLAHENGSRQPNLDAIKAYARAFKVTPEWLQFGAGGKSAAVAQINHSISAPKDGVAEIPRYPASVSAGGGSFNLDEMEPDALIPFTWEFLEKHLGRQNTNGLVMLSVSGDSMEPTIGSGDLVMIDRHDTTIGDGVFAFVLDNVARLKRFNVNLRGVQIISDNPHYETETYSRDEVADLLILGRARWVGRVLSR